MKITDKYVFFWGGEFSNFYPCTIVDDEFTFNCSEQIYMYVKAKMFNDDKTAEKIYAATDPKEQKKLGRSVQGFKQKKWDIHKEWVMFHAVYKKFDQNPELKELLLSTRNHVIVEASPYDSIWGIGIGGVDNPAIEDPANWKGQNLLGEVIMRVRRAMEIIELMKEVK